MGVISSRSWRFQMTRSAGAFAADTLIGPDVALGATGLWMVEWYAIMRLGGDTSVTYLIRDGATTIYQHAKRVGGAGTNGEDCIHRILVAVHNTGHVAQVETNSGLGAGDSVEVCKGVQLLGTLRETQSLGFIETIDRGDLLALRGWW